MLIEESKIIKDTSVNDLLEYAKSEISNLNQGEEFLLKDLFLGYKWDRIKKGDRTRLGIMFLQYAQAEGESEIQILNKTPQNQQMYAKK